MQESRKIAKQAFKDTLRYGECPGHYCEEGTLAVALHECPYDADVHNDPNSECDCCDICTRECAQNI